MCPVRNLRRLIEALLSRWADSRDQRADAYRALRVRFRVRRTSDRAQRWLDQVTAGTVAAVLATLLVWALRHGHWLV